MSLVHMMPEATEIYAIWAAKEGIEKPFPLPYVGFFMGYMLILGVDRVAAKACGAGHSHGGHSEAKTTPEVEMGSKAVPVFENINETERFESPTKLRAGAASEEKKTEGATVSKAAAIILVLALGAHAFFEGIAFGLLTTIESAGQLGAGIMIHKSAAAISLGGAFARTGYNTKEIILFLGIFSIIAPLGIIIGMQIAESNKIIDTIFMSVSGGTFIYVACSEIIVGEFDKGHYQWLKMILVFLGGTLITILWFFDEHSHAEEGDDHSDHLMRMLMGLWN